MSTLSQSTKRKIRVTKLITDQGVYFLIALKSMKKFCIINFINILTIFFPSQCKFKKRCSTQHCVSILIEKFEEAVEEAADMGNNFGALLTDSSKHLIALITIY